MNVKLLHLVHLTGHVRGAMHIFTGYWSAMFVCDFLEKLSGYEMNIRDRL